ncbi:MAG: GNAT family N-acetyltransferase [Acetobacteraceae bacterium]
MIDRLTAEDHPRWTELWTAYLAFYHTTLPQAVFDATWARLLAGEGLHGFALRHEGRMVGLVHYLFHPHAWSTQPACYLQDLFVDPAVRGTGGGRRLIEAVAEAARAYGAGRLYWTTQDHNATARLLYDRLAKHNGFIRYDYPL